MKVIAIIGKSCSGKSTIAKILESKYGFNRVVTCTTRPRRDKEQEGIDYFFLSPDSFEEKMNGREFLEVNLFKNWLYGTPYSSFSSDKVNVWVTEPSGLRAILKKKDVELRIFLLESNDKVRFLRYLTREENPDIQEMIRRYYADEKDFNMRNLPDGDYNIVYTDDEEKYKAQIDKILYRNSIICPAIITLPDLVTEAKNQVEKEYEADLKFNPFGVTEEHYIMSFMKILDKAIDEVAQSMTGYIAEDGLVEALQILIGEDYTTSEGTELAKQIKQLFKDKCDKYKLIYIPKCNV